jgi:hypothetical protein
MGGNLMISRHIRSEILTSVLVGGLACGDDPHSGRDGADGDGIGIGGTETDGATDHGDGNITLPGCQTPVGISIDADGMVWVVDRGASHAYKVDPTDYSTQIVEGLVNPYTYLGLVANPPAG